MKLVIDIPESIYNHTQEYEVGGFNQENDTKLFMAIKNGKPLPEHHGDLIDRDALIYNQTHHCGYQTPFNLIDEDNLKSAPTIIEANKGSDSDEISD